MESAVSVIKACTVQDNIVKLPAIELGRAIRNEVARKLGSVGGKWNEKVKGFVFSGDPSGILDQITGGPIRTALAVDPMEKVAEELVRLAAIRENQRILIPEAGTGVVLRAIDRVMPDCLTDHTEADDKNRDFLRLHYSWSELVGRIFIQFDRPNHYHRIVAIPPLTECRDLTNIRWMYRQLTQRGRLVSLINLRGEQADRERWAGFRKWLDQVEGQLIEVDREEFNVSGMGIVMIDRKSKG